MNLVIREANHSDLVFVSKLMQAALEPFYGGDHIAHAERIFEAHVKGGNDDVGHFSFSQKMFIAVVDDCLAGMVHIVGKRQGTYKISPLILHPDFRGCYGLGGKILAFIEEYVKNLEARQIYCTVASQNILARNFFKRHGYVQAGESESHYKEGITELMMYKLFGNEAFSEEFDLSQISVIDFNESHENGVRKLILEKLSSNFDGVDNFWVDSLFNGHRRRDSSDVNKKFKIIYVAVSSDGEVLGVAGATPKKGEPIKLMPLIAKNFQAFVALLIDVPYLLKEYGRKLYTHNNPSALEVIALQRFGWQLNALMPEAYKKDVTTQQWSFNFHDSCVRALRSKTDFLENVKNGRKTLEVRVNYPSIKKIKVGNLIKLYDFNQVIIAEVKAYRHYKSFAEMLLQEDANKIAPGHDSSSLLKLLQNFYSSEKENLGVVVFEILPV